jgi:hypothetical protein
MALSRIRLDSKLIAERATLIHSLALLPLFCPLLNRYYLFRFNQLLMDGASLQYSHEYPVMHPWSASAINQETTRNVNSTKNKGGDTAIPNIVLTLI